MYISGMKTIILLTKDDIECSVVGSHIEIKTKGDTIINLNPEAYKELFNDLKAIFEHGEPKSFKWTHDENGNVSVLTPEQSETNKGFDTKEQAFQHWKDELIREYMEENKL